MDIEALQGFHRHQAMPFAKDSPEKGAVFMYVVCGTIDAV